MSSNRAVSGVSESSWRALPPLVVRMGVAAAAHPGDVLMVSELFRLCRDLVDILSHQPG